MFESLISYQIVAALAGGAYSMLLCWLYRSISWRRGGLLARDVLWTGLAQIPVGFLLLAIAYFLFQHGLLSSPGFFLVIGLLFYAAFFWIPLASLRFALARPTPGRSPLPPVQWWLRVLFLLYVISTFSVGFYAWFIEPSDVRVSHHTIVSRKIVPESERDLRIVHISDLQTSYLGSREIRVPALVEELHPDLILFSGDLFTRAMYGDAPQQAAHAVLARLSAPFGFYGVTGDSETPYETEALLAAHGHCLLRNERRLVNVRGQPVVIVGLDRLAPDLSLLDLPTPPGALVILLTHTPDVVMDLGLDLDAPFLDSELEVAIAASPGDRAHQVPDLILAGHTHGGQIVFPLLGAPITFSGLGPRYASGLFQFGETTLNITRGLGMEGHFAPRVRFLCPPEVSFLAIRPPGMRTEAEDTEAPVPDELPSTVPDGD